MMAVQNCSCASEDCRINGCRIMRSAQKFTSPQRPASIAEQMGVDPISKLAAAINNLADALRDKSK